MSNPGNKTVISEVEENDLGFTRLWSKEITMKCGSIFLNSEFPNDIFFNKLTNVTCTSDSMINEAMTLFRKYKTTPFIYSLNYSKLEDFLKKKQFVHYDIQHVLRRNSASKKTNGVRKITADDSMLWSKTFCDAYDCHDWILPVDKIVQNSLSLIEYYADKSNSSCVALYEKNSILGLYCLGTVPHMRRKGLAESLIDFAQNEVAKRKLQFLMLETYENDNLLEFYSKLGFQEIYKKNVYTISV